MYEFDLLKGSALPKKFSAGSLVYLAAAVALPVVLAIALCGLYLNNSVVTSVTKNQIKSCEDMTDRLSQATENGKSTVHQTNIVKDSLTDVQAALSRQMQWSPVLQTIAEQMPRSIVLTEMSVERRAVKKKVPKKDDPKKNVTISIPARTLHMTVTGSDQSNYDTQVKEFRDSLWKSESLGPRLENIVVSQKTDEVEGARVVSYDISCIFKTDI